MLTSLLVACGPPAGVQGRSLSTTGQSTLPELQDLRSIADLESRFNQDVGKPRLVLLVSPT